MSSKHLIDPELLPLIEALPAVTLTSAELGATRAMMDGIAATFVRPPPPGVEVRELAITAPSGAHELRLTIAKPTAGDVLRPGILHIHGGGYVMGAPGTEMTIAAYAAQLGAVAVAVDYRLAPETPHPGPIEDCYAALQWLKAEATNLGVDVNRIAVTGESAGGGLAAALALLARDRGEIAVAFLHLVFPMLDDRTAVATDLSPVFGEFVWTRDANRFGWSALLGGEPGEMGVSPYAAAARADDVAGLPPTFIACGALDLFLEENLNFALRLMRAGVPTELHVYPGAPHGFMFVQEARVSQAFSRDSLAAFARALLPGEGA